MPKAEWLLLAAFVARAQSERTLEHAIRRIEAARGGQVIAGRPDSLPIRDVALICIKQDRRLELWIDGAPAKAYPMTAFSGGPGPKRREGGQRQELARYVPDPRNLK